MIGSITPHFKKTAVVNYALVCTIFLLNFLGVPAVKWVNLAYTAFVFITIFSQDLKQSLPVIICYSFLEGQGRVLWEYNPFFRIAFDLALGIAILRNVFVKRKEGISKILPAPLLWLMILHFLWYIPEILNPNSVSVMLPLVSIKAYIFPFFLFFLLRQNKDAFEADTIKSICVVVLFLVFMEVLLSLYQVQFRQDFMLSISQYYKKQMRDYIFMDAGFRPFGTTHSPGAISTFFYLTVGFLYISNKFTKKRISFITLLFTLTLTALMVCQIRSALIKYILITFGIFAGMIFSSKNRAKTLVRGSIFITLLIATSFWYLSKNIDDLGTNLNFDASIKRWDVESYDQLRSKRLTPEKAFRVLAHRLDLFPIGIGPGATGASFLLSTKGSDVQSDPIADFDNYWTFDNFYISVIIEFGYGGFFYIILLLCIPFLLWSCFIKLYKGQNYFASKIVMIAFIHTVIILIGNWAFVGIPYNPESFFFWLWTAIGLNVYDNTLKDDKMFSDEYSF